MFEHLPEFKGVIYRNKVALEVFDHPELTAGTSAEARTAKIQSAIESKYGKTVLNPDQIIPSHSSTALVHVVDGSGAHWLVANPPFEDIAAGLKNYFEKTEEASTVIKPVYAPSLGSTGRYARGGGDREMGKFSKTQIGSKDIALAKQATFSPKQSKVYQALKKRLEQ